MIYLTLSQSSDESVSMFDEADDDDSLHEFGLRYVYCAKGGEGVAFLCSSLFLDVLWVLFSVVLLYNTFGK